MECDVVAEGLAKRYPGGVWGAVDVRLCAKRGEVTVLLGPNGSGKTTTVNMLAAILRPTRGTAKVLGFDVSREPWEVRRRVALVPQEGRPDYNWSPWQAVKWYLVARGFSLGEAEKAAREWLERLGLWGVRDRPCWGLSVGTQRRVMAAMALATQAPVVFLDEPTSGVDVDGKYAIWGAIREAARAGRAVVYTTHDMREAEMVADRVVVLSSGKTVAEGSPRELIGSLPYKYKVVVRGGAQIDAGSSIAVWSLSLGDIAVHYFRAAEEAHEFAKKVSSGVEIERVGLEDVYLFYTRNGGGRQ